MDAPPQEPPTIADLVARRAMRPPSRHTALSARSDHAVLALLCPAMARWWKANFGQFTAAQRLAIPALAQKRHTLLTAPTGGGKTLAAVAAAISEMFVLHQTDKLPTATHILYVSPLRALNTDILQNLRSYTDAIVRHANLPESPIRIAQRTGDTPPAERLRIIRRPPHIFITTPESLALCLAAPGSRAMLATVNTVILDELHSLADSKRGVDLAVSVERVTELATARSGAQPVRVGLSATVRDLHQMADYLVGSNRCCAIGEVAESRHWNIDIANVLGDCPFARRPDISDRVRMLLEKQIRMNRTTLIFANTRASAEAHTFALRQAMPELAQHIQPHHGSLDRTVRLDIEQKMKTGELAAVCTSASLDMGIDVGSVDHAVLLGPPRGVARAIQRIGRSGHAYCGISRGTLAPMAPHDLLECIVTAALARHGHLDPQTVPENCLDILCQQLVGMALAAEPDGLDAAAALALLRRTHSYRQLHEHDFQAAIDYLCGPGAKLRRGGRPTAPAENAPAQSSWTDRLFISRRGIRGLYSQNAGTIIAGESVPVRFRAGPAVGSVDEAFAELLKPADRFLLAGQCVQIITCEVDAITVEPCAELRPTAPRWLSGQMPLGAAVADALRAFRKKVRAVAPAGAGAIAHLLIAQWQCPPDAARVAALYLLAQHQFSDIPTDDSLSIERFFQDDTATLVVHSLCGRAANEALSRAVALRLFRATGSNATVSCADIGFALAVRAPAARQLDRVAWRGLLTENNLRADVSLAAEKSELFAAQFRHVAMRALAIVRTGPGGRATGGELQRHAKRLYAVLRRNAPDHILLTETRRAVLRDALDIAAAETFAAESAAAPLRLLDLPGPSPFAFALLGGSDPDAMHLADAESFLLAWHEKMAQNTPAARIG